MAAVTNLEANIAVTPWLPDRGQGWSARKTSLAKHKRTVVIPALHARDSRVLTREAATSPAHSSLPWAWIATHGGEAFRREGFDVWWQLRILVVMYPKHGCPWCRPIAAKIPDCSREHLETSCAEFARRCLARGIQLQEAFLHPPDDTWFINVLIVMAEVYDAVHIAGVD